MMSNTTNHGPGVRCQSCGATLDPGERCDCERREADGDTVVVVAIPEDEEDETDE